MNTNNNVTIGILSFCDIGGKGIIILKLYLSVPQIYLHNTKYIKVYTRIHPRHAKSKYHCLWYIGPVLRLMVFISF